MDAVVDIGRLVALSTMSTTARAERDIGTAQAGVWTTDFFGGVRVDPDATVGRIDAHLWAGNDILHVVSTGNVGGTVEASDDIGTVTALHGAISANLTATDDIGTVVAHATSSVRDFASVPDADRAVWTDGV